MRIKILGSGSSSNINKNGKSKRFPSSILIDNKLLVDATSSLENIKEKTIEAILITHSHDTVCSGLKNIEKFMKNKTIDIYAFHHAINDIKQKIGQKEYIRYNILKPFKKYNILGYKVIPFSVNHSVIFTRFDSTAAYKINNTLYCGSIDQDFFMSNKRNAWLLKREIANSAITFLDGKIYDGRLKGHLNIMEVIPELDKWKANNIYFTQIGNDCPSHEKLLAMVKLKNPTYNVCYDGMAIDIQDFDEKLKYGISKDLPVEDISDTDLIGIHSILHVWYQKGKSEWSQEDIYNLHKRIFEEMLKRSLRHLPKDSLDKKIKTGEKNIQLSEGKTPNDLVNNHEIIHEWADMIEAGKKIHYKNNEITLLKCKELHTSLVAEMKKMGFVHDIETAPIPKKMDGLILASPHGKMIWDGTKTLIIKPKKFDIASKFFYLIENSRCYGILKITTVEKITPEEFIEFNDLHKISDEEKTRWWKNQKELYAYQFNVINRYMTPKKVRLPLDVQTFVRSNEIEMLQEKEFKNQIVGQNDKPINNFPQNFQDDLKYVMDNKLKPRFVIQHHEKRESLHTDIRLEIPNKNYLQGFTLASPSNVNKEDNVSNDAKNVLVVELKSSNKKMLEYEDILNKTEIISIVGKGTYSIWEVNDHKIGIEFYCDKGKVKNIKDRIKQDYDNLKDLKGKFSFSIAHIEPERWVGFFTHIKSKPVQVKMFDNPYVKSLLEDLSIALGNQPILQRIELEASIREELGKDFKLPYEFNFIALKEGEFNGVWYSKDELIKAYPSLKGKDLTIDHGKSVRDVVGRIKDVWWNDELEQIEGTAEITDDENIARKVNKKLITGVSVEVYVTYSKGEHGLTAKDAIFQALSIVTRPACKTCRIINNDVTSE